MDLMKVRLKRSMLLLSRYISQMKKTKDLFILLHQLYRWKEKISSYYFFYNEGSSNYTLVPRTPNSDWTGVKYCYTEDPDGLPMELHE